MGVQRAQTLSCPSCLGVLVFVDRGRRSVEGLEVILFSIGCSDMALGALETTGNG